MTKIRPSHPSTVRHTHDTTHDVSQDVRGRLTRTGTSDDSIGRNRKGTPDDSIGRNRKGTPDDSIGRNRNGTPDDSIGRHGRTSTGNNLVGAMFPSTGKNSEFHAPLQGRPSLGERSSSPIGDMLSFELKGLSNRTNDDLNHRSTLTPEQALARPAARKVLADPEFTALPAADRQALVDVISKGGAKAATAVQQLIKDHRLDVLHATDASGQTVLAQLERIASSKQPQVAGDVIDDISKPKELEQGFAPTCTATSMQYEMAKERPAEYARLMAGLVADGHVTMAGGGDLTIDVDKAITSSDKRRDFRSDSEAVFQSAVMEFADGKARYDLDQQVSVDGTKTYQGLYPAQIREALGQLFGVRYETKEILSDDMARAELDVIASRERPNRPVLFDIDMGSFNHNVSLESVSDKYVYYRDPSTGDVKAMARDEFIKKLTSVHYAAE